MPRGRSRISPPRSWTCTKPPRQERSPTALPGTLPDAELFSPPNPSNPLTLSARLPSIPIVDSIIPFMTSHIPLNICCTPYNFWFHAIVISAFVEILVTRSFNHAQDIFKCLFSHLFAPLHCCISGTFPSLYATHFSLIHGFNTGLTKSPFPISIAFTSSFPVKSGQNKIILPHSNLSSVRNGNKILKSLYLQSSLRNSDSDKNPCILSLYHHLF